MNPRLIQLIQLLKKKQDATKQANLELIKAKEQFTQNKACHEQLLRHRQDYLQPLALAGLEDSLTCPLSKGIEFINHLDTALIQLNTHLSQLAKIILRAEINYNQAKISEDGVRKIIDRVLKDESSKLQRGGQKESDEYAQKQGYSKNMNNQPNNFGE